MFFESIGYIFGRADVDLTIGPYDLIDTTSKHISPTNPHFIIIDLIYVKPLPLGPLLKLNKAAVGSGNFMLKKPPLGGCCKTSFDNRLPSWRKKETYLLISLFLILSQFFCCC